MAKKWYTSKTLWIGLISIVSTVVLGKDLPPEAQAAILGVILIILRTVTKEAIEW